MSEKVSVIDRFLEMQKVNIPKKFVKATTKQAKEIYFDEEIETFGEEIMVEEFGKSRKKEYIALYEAIRTDSVLRGTITSCYVDEGTKIVNVAIVQKNFKVIIPLPCLIKLPEEVLEMQKELSEERQLNFLKMMGNMRIGSVVDFMPRQINEYEGICIASRLMALDRMKYLNYFPQVDRKIPAVRVGCVAQGRVCYTKKASMCVEVGGVEVIMRQVDISYLRISDVQDMYHPGDYVPVKVTAINFIKDEKGNVVDISIEANIKEAMKNPQKENFNNYSVNESVRGTVTQRTSEGLFVRIKNTHCDVKCAPEKDIDELSKADVGDEVLIKIIAKEEETYRLKGVIKWNYSKNSF